LNLSLNLAKLRLSQAINWGHNRVATRSYEANPGCMLLTDLWLWQFQTILCWIIGAMILSTSRDCVLDGVLIVNGPTRAIQTMSHGSDSAILDGDRQQPIFFAILICHLTYLKSESFINQHHVLYQAISWHCCYSFLF
jgi:hypothetical protein